MIRYRWTVAKCRCWGLCSSGCIILTVDTSTATEPHLPISKHDSLQHFSFFIQCCDHLDGTENCGVLTQLLNEPLPVYHLLRYDTDVLLADGSAKLGYTPVTDELLIKLDSQVLRQSIFVVKTFDGRQQGRCSLLTPSTDHGVKHVDKS